MSEKSLTPRIRFKGFADAWEQRKLGDVTSSYSGGTPLASNKDFYIGEIPFIRSGEISQNETELYINEKELNFSSAKMVHKGDILYALYGATSGEVAISSIDGAINQAILAIIPKREYNSYFMMYWLRREKSNIISTYLQGGQGNLSGTIIKSLDFCFPNNNEQRCIGELLCKIDICITLHQREQSDRRTLICKKIIKKSFFIAILRDG